MQIHILELIVHLKIKEEYFIHNTNEWDVCVLGRDTEPFSPLDASDNI